MITRSVVQCPRALAMETPTIGGGPPVALADADGGEGECLADERCRDQGE
jgi:hypothetical protein